MLEVRKVIKVTGKEEAAKNKEVHQNRDELGLHPTSPPTGTLAVPLFQLEGPGEGLQKPNRQEEVPGLAQWHFRSQLGKA